MKPNSIRMVCFDAGGVLVRICRSWEEGCRVAGIEYRWSEVVQAGEAERVAISNAYQRGEIACSEFFEQMATTAGGLYAADDIRVVHDAWILGEYPGVRELIDRLNGTDELVTGLLSNTSARHWEGLWMQGSPGGSAVGRIEHPHASHLLGLLKPGVEIYRAFEQETGYTGSEILFFDDLPENVAAARAAGWRAEVIDFAGDTARQIAGHLAACGVGGQE
ncbi:hypothetical protein MNBD_PLANCTO03-176 [hydrothermal vent metagenome]|uniref:HAD family phosphatase n=1 Tax=hydrothermal vent metagenome TaxID=652676 RepID=A0A3B1DDB0_9ZZZZ